jgi:hypothetical protein
MPHNRIVSNIFADLQEPFRVYDPHFGESFLPDRGPESQLAPSAEGEATFDELYGALNCHIATDRQQNMKVIRHDYEIMQAVFSLGAVIVQHVNEQGRGPAGLKKVSLVTNRRGDEKTFERRQRRDGDRRDGSAWTSPAAEAGSLVRSEFGMSKVMP